MRYSLIIVLIVSLGLTFKQQESTVALNEKGNTEIIFSNNNCKGIKIKFYGEWKAGKDYNWCGPNGHDEKLSGHNKGCVLFRVTNPNDGLFIDLSPRVTKYEGGFHVWTQGAGELDIPGPKNTKITLKMHDNKYDDNETKSDHVMTASFTYY